MESGLSVTEAATQATSWPGGPILDGGGHGSGGGGLRDSSAIAEPDLPVYPWTLPLFSSMLFSIFAVGSVANALVLFVTVRQHLRDRTATGTAAAATTTTTIPILSLSVADSLVMAALPPWGLYVRDGYAWPRGAAAAHLCRASGLSLLLGLFASALTLSWISVERCAVVLAPASAALLRSPRVSAAALCASWLPSAALAALLTADVSAYARANGTGGATVCGYAAEDRFAMWSLGNRPGRGLLLNLVGFALPFAVLGASYGAVCRRLCALSRFGGSRIPKDSVLRLLFALTVVFCVTWCPYTAVNLYSSGGGGFGGVRSGDERTANTVGELCMAVGLLNSALNPLLYCLWTRRNWQQLLPRVPALCATRRPARVGASV